MTNPAKPGLLTSEFLMALLSPFIGTLVIFGVIQPSQVDLFNSVVTQGGKVILDAVVFWSMIKPVIKYVEGRVELKKQMLQQGIH